MKPTNINYTTPDYVVKLLCQGVGALSQLGQNLEKKKNHEKNFFQSPITEK